MSNVEIGNQGKGDAKEMQSEICANESIWTSDGHQMYSVQLRFLPLPRMELRQKGRGEAEGRVGIQIGSLPRWLCRCFDRLKESQR